MLGQVYAPGPRAGGQTGGRRRNTLVNMASKQYVFKRPTPPLPPGQTPPIFNRTQVNPQQQIPSGAGGPTPTGTGATGGAPPAAGGMTIAQVLGLQSTLQSNVYGYYNALAAAHMAAENARGTFQAAQSSIKDQAAQSMVGAESNALDRGILGSSVDLTGRAQVRGQMAGDIVAARSQMMQQFQQSALDRQQANQQYQLGLLDYAQQAAGYIADNSVQNFQNNIAGVGNVTPQQFQDIVNRFLRRYAGPTGNGAPTTLRAGVNPPPTG